MCVVEKVEEIEELFVLGDCGGMEHSGNVATDYFT